MLDRRIFLGSTACLLAGPAAAAQADTPTAVSTFPAHFQIENTARARTNAEAVERQKALLNEGKITEGVLYFAEDTRNHGRPVGRKGVLRVLTDIYTTFPDWHSETETLLAFGDEVIVRSTTTGTHKGVGQLPLNGGLLVGVPPTGKQFKTQSIHWFTLKDGLIVDHRANRDESA